MTHKELFLSIDVQGLTTEEMLRVKRISIGVLVKLIIRRLLLFITISVWN